MHLQRAENQPDAAEQKEFADWLLEVGEGRIPTIRGLENNIIRLPNDIILPSQNINDLINLFILILQLIILILNIWLNVLYLLQKILMFILLILLLWINFLGMQLNILVLM